MDGLIWCQCGLGMGSESKQRTYGKTETYYCYSVRRKWRGEEVSECKNKRSLDRELTEKSVMDLVKDVVGKSVTLKEQFKQDILSKKNETDKDIKEEKNKLEVRIKKLQGEIEHTIDNISVLEFERIQGKKDKKVVDKILTLLEKEKETLEKEYQRTTQEIEDVDNRKEWLDWLEKYGEDLRIKTSTHTKKQDFLKGLIKEVIVHPEFGNNRDGKEIQVGQTLEVRFKMKIVNDKLKYNNLNKKSDGYEIVNGTYRKKTSGLTLSKGRGQPKKKVLNSEKKRLFQPIPQLRKELEQSLSESGYSYYLCFNVSKRFNNLNPQYNSKRYTEEQFDNYQLIKSLYDSGMSYRKISKHLNEKGILTTEGKKWGETGNYVYSVLKRFKEREERLGLRNKKYKTEISEMRIELDR